ncbi:MAG: cell division protein FtsQ/DivIB [Gallionella sp.]|nr:cell division protein FtsQ/DivIB [Gallionella sp.]
MWDNAPLLRNIADTLTFFSVLAVLYGAAFYAVHLPGLLPLQSVRLSAPLQRVAAAEVLRTVRSETNGNFFTVNIEHVRQSLEKLTWVRSIGIRREFPHGLLVDMEEHQALARWNGAARHDGFGTSLVNQYGEVFFVEADWVAESGQALPDLTGPEGSSAEVAQQYMQFSRLIAPLNLQTVQLALSARHAWQMRLNNGMVLELGREDMQQRLARFVAVQRTEDRRQRTEGAAYVDLRYRNGFAVRQITNEKG